MQGGKIAKIEKRIYELLNEVDHALEDKYDDKYRLHPSRPERGQTSNPTRDGLINITAKFTTGIGSQHGKGYNVDIRLKTLENVDKEVLEEIDEIALNLIKEKLPDFFPERKLEISRDGNVIKIHGDFFLGSIWSELNNSV